MNRRFTPRTWLSVSLSSLLALGIVAVVTPAAGASPGAPAQPAPVRIITDGHVDGFAAIAPDPSSVELQVKDNDGYHPWDDVIIVVPDAAQEVVPAANDLSLSYAFLGAPGSTVWRIKESPDVPGVPWVGWTSAHESLATLGGTDLHYRIEGVTGQGADRPGELVVWKGSWGGALSGTEKGAHRPMYSTRTGLPAANSANLPGTGGNTYHVHFDWTFGAPGVYCVAAAVTAQTHDGQEVTDRRQMTFVVGDQIDPATVQPCGRVQPYPAPEPISVPDAQAGTAVLSRGWMAFTPEIVGDELRVPLRHEDDFFTRPGIDYAIDDVVLHSTSASGEVGDGGPTVGPPGSTFYSLPSRRARHPFLPTTQIGWDMTKITSEQLVGGLTWRLVDVRGPGDVVLLAQRESAGSVFSSKPGYRNDSTTLLPGTAEVRDAGDNWRFSQPGVYCLDMQWEGQLASGEPVSATHTMTIAVDSDDSEPIDIGSVVPGECVDTPDPNPGPSQTITAALAEDDLGLVMSVDPNDRDVAMDGRLSPSGDRWEADGVLRPVTVTDTRSAAPGWTVSGQVSDFEGPDGALAGRYLGWSPRVLSASPAEGVTPGAIVAPGFETGNGIATSSTLADAEPGRRGTAWLDADLRLELPTTTPPGAYDAVLTLTAI